MSLMRDFQRQKKKDPEYGSKAGFKVIGTMPGSAIGKQQAISGFEKEFENDIAALKAVKSIKQKESEKAEHLVPKYMPLVQSLCASNSDHPMLGQIIVWLFDINDILEAMKLALYCIEHKVPMPERFKRDLATYLCDAILEWAEKEQEAGRSCEPYFSQIWELAGKWDLPDQVTAKFYRLRGIIAMEKEDFKQAEIELKNAKEYGAKVKTLLEQAQKQLDPPLK